MASGKESVAGDFIMHGLMMDAPLLTTAMLRCAAVAHGETQVVSRCIDGSIHRHCYSDAKARYRKRSAALLSLSLQLDDRVGPLLWSTHHHFGLVESGREWISGMAVESAAMEQAALAAIVGVSYPRWQEALAAVRDAEARRIGLARSGDRPSCDKLTEMVAPGRVIFINTLPMAAKSATPDCVRRSRQAPMARWSCRKSR
jgi:hypothetical protein